jgi:hypothetical protein
VHRAVQSRHYSRRGHPNLECDLRRVFIYNQLCEPQRSRPSRQHRLRSFLASASSKQVCREGHRLAVQNVHCGRASLWGCARTSDQRQPIAATTVLFQLKSGRASARFHCTLPRFVRLSTAIIYRLRERDAIKVAIFIHSLGSWRKVGEPTTTEKNSLPNLLKSLALPRGDEGQLQKGL